MAGFVQIIEFKTSQIDEIEALSNDMRLSPPETSQFAAEMTALCDGHPGTTTLM